MNTRITLDTGQRWSFDLYGTNLTNDPGVSGGTGVQTIPNPLAFRNVIRPRTMGVEIHFHP